MCIDSNKKMTNNRIIIEIKDKIHIVCIILQDKLRETEGHTEGVIEGETENTENTHEKQDNNYNKNNVSMNTKQ